MYYIECLDTGLIYGFILDSDDEVELREPSIFGCSGWDTQDEAMAYIDDHLFLDSYMYDVVQQVITYVEC